MSPALQLPVVPEPVGLRPALRALAEENPARAQATLTDPDGVAAYLWSRWGPDVEAAGVSREGFLSVVAEYRRELWHWVWGDRTWEQCVQGLAGRLARRVSRRASG